ncbi:ATP-binding protein [Marinobacter sp. HL-58]|uniref:sensor histidine kinase n=1 Tax=Marinobacter sp. HL-58 TaxID=1479237 RepID=UPI00047F627E|nr:ATP-binding protein [Marinobacter sp. HL-58]KPQ03015.1 MAG: two component signal transduction system NarL family histidine kinase [Marinobacter sp. HL-58]
MRAYSRVALLMLAVFALVYGAGAVFYLKQARLDVARELDSISTLAGMIGSPEEMGPELIAGLRHLRPSSEEGAVAGNDDGVPFWFVRALGADQASGLSVIGDWQVDPYDEVEEIWENFVLVSLAFGIGMLLCFSALFLAIRWLTEPLRRVGKAMDDIGEGEPSPRLPRQQITELDQLVYRFNAMADALDTEQKTVARLMNELLELQDRERAHIARVLHDDLGQYITGIRAQARGWLYDPELNERQRKQAREMAEHCETVQQHFRHLLRDLHPLVMEQLGLGSAIHHLVDQWQQLSGLTCKLTVDERLPELTGDKQTHLYRFMQEALNNVARHAAATKTTLDVTAKPGVLQVEVRDNGRGADDLSARAGLGLRSMCERARSLGGKVEFFSQSGEGTSVCLTIPLK